MPPKKSSLKSSDMFVTNHLLNEFRSELKSDLTTVRLEARAYAAETKQQFLEMDKRFIQIDARFVQVDKRFEQIDLRFEQVDVRFIEVITLIEKQGSQTASALHRITALVEEQNVQNRYVLDGYTQLNHAIEDLSTRVKNIEARI